jgi:GNAT superfamily N-acetyltransferase
MSTTYTIRRGTEADIPAAFALIQELASYENAPEQVTNTPAKMLADGFGPQPIFGFYVAERGPEVVGLALYYTRYSTWKGRCLYLEDLVVTQAHRRQHLGRLLLDAVVREALAQDMALVIWQVLDWNTPAIEFYKKLGAAFEPEWVNCKLDRAALENWQFGA